MLARTLVLAILLASPSYASRLAYTLSGGSEFKGIAVAWPNVAVADTVDGDRFDSDAGVVTIYDGRTGELRFTLREPTGEWGGLFGRAMAGSPRFIAVTSGYDRVHVFDERGQLVRTLRPAVPDASHFGDRLAFGGEFLIVRELVNLAPSAERADVLLHVYSIVTGRLLHTIVGHGGKDFGDVIVVAKGDTIIAGSPSGEVVCAHDARAGFERWSTPSPRRHGGDRFGAALSVYQNDLLVGAPGGHRLEFGNAYLLDVQTGEVRRKYHGPGRGSGFGSAVAIRRNQVLVGAPDGYEWRKRHRGRAFLLDKQTGDVVRSFKPEYTGSDVYTGTAVAFVGLRPAVVDFYDDTDTAPVIRVFR